MLAAAKSRIAIFIPVRLVHIQKEISNRCVTSATVLVPSLSVLSLSSPTGKTRLGIELRVGESAAKVRDRDDTPAIDPHPT